MKSLTKRILQQSPNNWTKDGNVWTRLDHDGQEQKLIQILERWRLRLGSSGSMSDEWEADTAQECLQVADFLSNHKLESLAWRQLQIEPIIAAGPSNVLITIEKNCDSAMGLARVRDVESKQDLGHYSFVRTDWLGQFVLGKPTINGAVMLNERIQGKGVGKFLYDTIEGAFELPVVPHGRNSVHGALTAKANRFWEKRANDRAVPGVSDPAVDARQIQALNARTYLDVERSMAFMSGFAVEVSKLTGWKIRGLVVDSQGEDQEGLHPFKTWCVLPDGICFTSTGFFHEQDLNPQDGECFRDFEIDQLGPVFSMSLSHMHWDHSASAAKQVIDRFHEAGLIDEFEFDEPLRVLVD